MASPAELDALEARLPELTPEDRPLAERVLRQHGRLSLLAPPEQNRYQRRPGVERGTTFTAQDVRDTLGTAVDYGIPLGGLAMLGPLGLVPEMVAGGALTAGARPLSNWIRGTPTTMEDISEAAVGGAAGAPVGRALGWAGKKALGVAEGAQRVAGEGIRSAAERLGFEPLPWQVSKGAARMTGALRGPYGSAHTIEKGLERQQADLEEHLAQRGLADLGGPLDAATAGERVQDVILPAYQALKDRVRQEFFVPFEQRAGAMPLQRPERILELAGEIEQTLGGGLDAAQSGQLKALLGSIQKRFTPQAVETGVLDASGKPLTRMEMPEPMTVADALKWRRDLGEIVDKPVGFPQSWTPAQEQRLYTRIDHAIKETVDGTEAGALWKAGLRKWGQEVVPYRRQMMGLLNQPVEKVAGALVRRGEPARMRRTFEALAHVPGGSDATTGIRANWFRQALEDAIGVEGFDARKFMTQWRKLGTGVQDEMMARDPTVRDMVTYLEGIAQGQQYGAQPSSTQRMLSLLSSLGLTSSGAGLYSLATGHPVGLGAVGAGVAAQIPPFGLARLLMKPSMTDLILPSVGMEATGRAARRGIGQVLGEQVLEPIYDDATRPPRRRAAGGR